MLFLKKLFGGLLIILKPMHICTLLTSTRVCAHALAFRKCCPNFGISDWGEAVVVRNLIANQ